MKKIISVITVICMLMCTLTVFSSAENSADHVIVLSSDENADGSYSCVAEIDGEKITEYDYTWHADPSQVHDDVEDVPGVYFTGTEPSGDEAIYIAHDIIYYPELDKEGFKKINYDGETEWAYYYTAGEYSDYIFSTLPVLGDSLPEDMMHSEEEAYKNAVLHITEAGTYEIKGTWHGQIKIDLGDEAFDDENAKVTLILSGADITCSVAPAIVFSSVYECDNEWEDRETYSAQVDTSDSGANVILTKDSINNISGANIFRLLKAKYKSDENESSSEIRVQKKYIKNDAAFYSYMSMNIDGEGTLNITSTYEGLDTELHLSINGGNINIYSQDDGINVNEDNVSVLSINGGTTHIYAGLGSEGDGIDSNGYLSINGGTLITTANPRSDSGLDSSSGSYIFGGT
ncbi:MAG: carbohydrate-binding domain-containing protein, partial [Acutalibacteraceae bacterium]